MTVHSPLLKDVPVGKGRYSYQTHASLVEETLVGRGDRVMLPQRDACQTRNE